MVASVASVTGPFSSGFDSVPGQRAEFGELARQSGRMLNELSFAQISGAENLLTKAMRALAFGDADRAEQLIQRAAQMAYDTREAGSPGVRAATLLLVAALAACTSTVPRWGSDGSTRPSVMPRSSLSWATGRTRRSSSGTTSSGPWSWPPWH